MRTALLIALLLAISATHSSAASAAERVGWEDLAVTARPSEDPFYGLDLDQKKSLDTLLRVYSLRTDGRTVPKALATSDSNARLVLEASGLDAEELIRKEIEFRESVQAQSSAVRTELDGRTIRIAGYLLPLEFDGTAIVEFLLVPYAGTCIHSPPLPPSQVIHVKHNDGYVVQRSFARLFGAVWVTGTLSIGGAKKQVELSDGTSSFKVGYGLKATDVRSDRQRRLYATDLIGGAINADALID